MEKEAILGIVLIFAGILLIFNSIVSKTNSDIKFAVGGFLGPFPFGFANNPEMLKIIIILCLIALFIFYLNKI